MSKRTTVAVATSALAVAWLSLGLASSTAVADTTNRCPRAGNCALSSRWPLPAMRRCQARSTRPETQTDPCVRFRCPTRSA